MLSTLHSLSCPVKMMTPCTTNRPSCLLLTPKPAQLQCKHAIQLPCTSRKCWRSAASTSTAPTDTTFAWGFQGTDFKIAVSEIGQSEDSIVVLPAISTVSTREEVFGVANELQSTGGFKVHVPDWPGFGDSTRQPMKYSADVFKAFLSEYISKEFSGPVRIVACGHSASFALQLAASHPELVSKLVLVAPTWIAPFRIMGVNPAIREALGSALRAPMIGKALFNSLSSESNLRSQYKSHVFTSEDALTDDFIAQKQAVTSQDNAQFAPSSFITGSLDLAEERSEVLDWLKAVKDKALVVIGNETPKKSVAEMNKMAEVAEPNVVRIPGSLGMHEEFGQEVAQAIMPFLKS